MIFSVFENALNYWFVTISVLRIVIGIITLVLASRALGKERNHNSEVFAKFKLMPGKFFSFILVHILYASA